MIYTESEKLQREEKRQELIDAANGLKASCPKDSTVPRKALEWAYFLYPEEGEA